MECEIITIFCLIDDLLKQLDHKELRRTEMTDSEVLTVLLVATRFFHGNVERSRSFLAEHKYVTNMLSKSQLNRRLHRISPTIWQTTLFFLHCLVRRSCHCDTFVIDSFPVPVCHNVRMKRCKILEGTEFLGFNAAKQTYFHGFKVHVIITETGLPVEFMFTPGSIPIVNEKLEIKDFFCTVKTKPFVPVPVCVPENAR